MLILLTPQVLSNPTQAGKVRPMEEVVREQLQGTNIRDEITPDGLKQKILDPIFLPKDKTTPEPVPEPNGTTK